MCFSIFKRKSAAELKNENFNKILFKMLGEREDWLQAELEAVDPADPAGTSSQTLMGIDAWKWLLENTTHIIPTLIDIASNRDVHGNSIVRQWPAGDLYSWIDNNHRTTAERQNELAFGPWDTDRDDGYQSGMCAGGHWSNYLRGTPLRCPIYDACQV